MTAREIFETTDWAHLLHAYGPADIEAAALESLLGDDAKAMLEGVDVLQLCFLRRGAIAPATPAALRYVLAVLSEWDPERNRDESFAQVHEELSIFVRDSGFVLRRCAGDLEGRTFDEESARKAHQLLDSRNAQAPGEAEAPVTTDLQEVTAELQGLHEALIYNAGLELMALTPRVLEVMVPRFMSAEGKIDLDTLDSLVPWLVLPGSQDGHQAVLGQVCVQLDRLDPQDPACRDDRLALVQVIVDLREDLSGLALDEDPAVRALAAISKPDHDGAVAELVKALVRMTEDSPEEVYGPTWTEIRDQADSAIIRVKAPLEEILPAALARIATSTGFLPDHDWLPLVTHCFPPSDGEVWERVLPESPSAAQLDVLQAVADNPSQWEETNSHAVTARHNLGLGSMSREALELFVADHRQRLAAQETAGQEAAGQETAGQETEASSGRPDGDDEAPPSDPSGDGGGTPPSGDDDPSDGDRGADPGDGPQADAAPPAEDDTASSSDAGVDEETSPGAHGTEEGTRPGTGADEDGGPRDDQHDAERHDTRGAHDTRRGRRRAAEAARGRRIAGPGVPGPEAPREPADSAGPAHPTAPAEPSAPARPPEFAPPAAPARRPDTRMGRRAAAAAGPVGPAEPPGAPDATGAPPSAPSAPDGPPGSRSATRRASGADHRAHQPQRRHREAEVISLPPMLSLVVEQSAATPAHPAETAEEAGAAVVFADKPMTEEDLKAIHELATWAPSATGAHNLRIVAVHSQEGRNRLLKRLSPSSRAQAVKAPVTLILAVGLGVTETLPGLDPRSVHYRALLESGGAQMTARWARTSTLVQVDFLIEAIRAIGLAAAPITGDDGPALAAEFFPGRDIEVLATLAVGHPARAAQRSGKHVDDVYRVV